MKSNKMLHIYADMESLIKKIDICPNNPEKSSTTNTGEHIPCDYSIQAYFITWERLHEKVFYFFKRKRKIYS